MRKLAVFKLPVILGFIYLLITGSTLDVYSGQGANCDESYPVYTVQPGDKLYEIGIRYGDFRFWEAIYIANAELIDNPDLIYPGQQLKIPSSVYLYLKSDDTAEAVLNNPFCATRAIAVSEIDFSRLQQYTRSDVDSWLAMNSGSNDLASLGEQESGRFDQKQIDRFREAFDAIVNNEKNDLANRNAENRDSLVGNRDSVQQQSERQIMMEIDGMILDETRSKVGRDFYDVFYTNWQQPPDTYNYSIRISEQPSPSLGTIIYVEVNDNETFRMRLQPRYEFIQQAGKYAVRQTYSYLQNNDHRLQIY